LLSFYFFNSEKGDTPYSWCEGYRFGFFWSVFLLYGTGPSSKSSKQLTGLDVVYIVSGNSSRISSV